MTQEEILALMKSDSDKGMEAVMKQYTALVYKIALSKLSSVCSQEDIEETVSDVFVEFYRKYETIDFSKGSLTSFIMLLAQRRSVDTFRKAVKSKNAYTVLSEDISDADTIFTEDIIMKREERNLLFDCILELGEPESTIIFRKFYFGETFAEIGKRLSLSANAVNKRYLRSIEKLSRELASIMKGEVYND